MASKATKLKRDIREMNKAIDSQLRVTNKGMGEWHALIADPTLRGITVQSLIKWHGTTLVQRREFARQMCIRLNDLQRQLIAIQNKSR